MIVTKLCLHTDSCCTSFSASEGIALFIRSFFGAASC